MFDEEDERRVSLRRGDGSIVLEIDDDGHGFDVETTTWGMGLRNLRERVESLAGCSRSRARLEKDDRPGDAAILSRLPGAQALPG